MAFTRNISIKDLGNYEKQLYKNAPKNAARVLEKTAKESVRILQQRTEQVDAVDTGKLKKGWTVVKGGRGISFSVVNKRRPAIAVAVVETGRRRGARRPPVRALELWVRRRLAVPGKEARNVAFAIARAIGRRGIRGRYITLGAMRPIIAGYRKNLNIEYEKFLRRGTP